jgi:hypothetical protein
MPFMIIGIASSPPGILLKGKASNFGPAQAATSIRPSPEGTSSNPNRNTLVTFGEPPKPLREHPTRLPKSHDVYRDPSNRIDR